MTLEKLMNDDITSAYPSAMTQLPKSTSEVMYKEIVSDLFNKRLETKGTKSINLSPLQWWGVLK